MCATDKAVLEAAALKHLSRWHKGNIDEELIKVHAYIAALIAHEASEDTALIKENPI